LLLVNGILTQQTGKWTWDYECPYIVGDTGYFCIQLVVDMELTYGIQRSHCSSIFGLV